MSKKINHKIVIVKWYDAWTSHGWNKREEFSKTDKGFCCQSAGFLIYEDSKCIRLALNISDENDSVADITTIPKAWIKSKKIIGITELFKE